MLEVNLHNIFRLISVLENISTGIHMVLNNKAKKFKYYSKQKFKYLH